MIARLVLLAIIGVYLTSAVALAQSVGGMSGIGVRIGGSAGNSGGGGGPVCTGAADFSNGCAPAVFGF